MHKPRLWPEPASAPAARAAPSGPQRLKRPTAAQAAPSAPSWRRNRPSTLGSCQAQLGRATIRRMDETRVDRWLCAVRLAKTRPLATSLCEGGHVKINGVSAKPSSRVHVGDRIE